MTHSSLRPKEEPSGPAERRPADWPRSAGLAVVLILAFAVVVYPLRRYVVEPRRQLLLGHHEPPGRRLALASQFAFLTSAGAALRVVPGSPSVELADLPTQAVITILGGFRGPYVVWLWVKVEDEKQKRIHIDLIDRYTKIAALQSDYPSTWTFHAWNLAWNVSVQWQSLERKYQWIRRAIEFLGEGYRKNPHCAEIMAEIGRIYSEKLGRSQEAPFYRRRAREDEGRSVFLVAYEWYDRARRANDRYGTMGHTLSKPVMYSQACHNLAYYSQELTQEAYDLLKESVDARAAGRQSDARQAYERGSAKLAEAASAWAWTRREWHDHIVRFEKEGLPAVLREVYTKFHGEADESVRMIETVRTGLNYENLPERLAQLKRPDLR